MNKQRIYVAGHNGMVGSSIIRQLKHNKSSQIITRSRDMLDLTNQNQVRDFFQLERPDQVYLAAARVGGIYANDTFPAEFIYENLMIEANVIHEAWRAGVKKLLFLGSSCIYPKLADQPMQESALLTGLLESTNEPYAIAKISGIKLCESYNRQYGNSDGIDYRSVMPTNLYGPGDNYHPINSHVIPALIRKFHEAKLKKLPSVVIWGSGLARREFLFVDDMAKACIVVMNDISGQYEKCTDSMASHLNVGSGEEFTIKELSVAISKCIGYTGNINFDKAKPDGAPRKLMDSSKMFSMGWRPEIGLAEGLEIAYKNFCETISD